MADLLGLIVFVAKVHKKQSPRFFTLIFQKTKIQIPLIRPFQENIATLSQFFQWLFAIEPVTIILHLKVLCRMIISKLFRTFVSPTSGSTRFIPLYLLRAQRESLSTVYPLGKKISMTAMLLDVADPPSMQLAQMVTLTQWIRVKRVTKQQRSCNTLFQKLF